MLNILNLCVEDLFVGHRIGDDIYGGFLRTNLGRFYINKGILMFFLRKHYRIYRRIIAAYRLIPPDFWSEEKSDWYRYMRFIHRNLLSRGLRCIRGTKRLRILCIGCGAGWEIWTLLNMSRHKKPIEFVVGCDIALRPLLQARKIAKNYPVPIEFVCCPAEFLPFKDNTFDIVTAIFGALDHSLNYVRAFREISRVLKRKGILIATVINKFALDWIIKVIKSPSLFVKTIKYADRTHARIRIPVKRNQYIRIPTHFYTTLEIKKLLKKFSLQIIELRGLFTLLPLNFKEKKFRMLHKLLAKMDRLFANVPPYNSLGRYIGIIARKIR